MMRINLFGTHVDWVEDFEGEFLGYPRIPWVSLYRGQNSTFRALIDRDTMRILHMWDGEE